MAARAPDSVPPRRRYDATRRQARARHTQETIVETAERLFLRDGFQATTIVAIAAGAGVSAETIYKRFGGKAGLVRAIRARGLAGDGAVHAEQRSNALQAAQSDPRRIIEGWGQLTIEVAPRVMPILQLVSAGAVGDPELANLRQELDLVRLKRMRQNARRLAATGRLQPGVRQRDIADVLWVCTSPELYDLVVGRRGWTPARYARFVVNVMLAALVPPET